jgi:predicted DNA-binding protein
MNKTEFIGLRLELETSEALKKQAKEEGRSKSNLIQLAIRQYLETSKKK